ncbi:endonuclease/exonuclease/phosphatase family protein [Pseudomonas aeruginosa]|nr:endonuclease/exonuclease/phosphatase family protein [Pseudomonas aeruginosa]
MILPRLQVLTVNTHKGFNPFNRRFILPELREAVRSVGADLVFLQEVLGSHSLHARAPCHPSRRRRNTSIWPTACGRSSPTGATRCIRRPPWQCRALQASDPRPPQPRRLGGGRNEERGLLHAVIDIGRPLHAVCVHLGLREAQRQRQLQLLCELVAGLPEREPVVVAGDFNDWRQRADQLLAGCGLREVFVGAQGRPARSFPGALAGAAAGPHLPAQCPRAPAAHPLAAALVAPVRPPPPLAVEVEP